MNKHILLLILLTTYVFSQNLINLSPSEKEFIKNNPVINVGAETDWPPFDFVEKGEYKGIAREYLEIISQNTGLKFNYMHGYTWSELINLTKEKKIDLLPILAKNKKREKFLEYTADYITIRDYFFSIEDKYSNIKQLDGRTLAVPKGYAQEAFLRKNYPNIKIYPVKNLLEALDAVITKKADGLISILPIINYLVKSNSLVPFKAQFAMQYDENRLHMAVKKDSKTLRNIVQKGLNSITKEQKDEISQKWIGEILNLRSLTKSEKDYIKNNNEIVFANELAWHPYDYNEEGKPKGYVIDYIKLVSDKLNIKPIFIADTWDNIVKRFKNKEIDVLPIVTFNKKRSTYLNFTQSYIKQSMRIITKKSRNDILYIADLNKRKVGLVKGWNSSTKIKNNYPNMNIIFFDKLEEVFKALENNLIDATIQNQMISSYYINKRYKELKIGNEIIVDGFNSDLFMGVDKDNKILLSILNKAMNQVSKNEIRALELKWLNISKNIEFTQKEKDFIDKKIVNVSYTENWAPISFTSQGKPYGLGYEFWTHIVNKTNLKVNIKMINDFSEALNKLKDKQTDVLITTAKTEERGKYAVFSDVYYKAPIGIATLQDKNYIPSAKELLGKKIAVGKNYTAHKLLKEAYPTMKFVTTKDIEEALELLSSNEVYAVVDNLPVLTHNIKKLGYSNIKISGTTGLTFDFQMMIREDYKVLQSIINKVLETMPPTKKEEIFNKWTKLEYTTKFDYSMLWKYLLPFVVIILIILYKNRQLISYQENLKKTQNELEISLKSFKELLNLTIEGIIVVKDKKVIFTNDEAVKIFNFKEKNSLLEKDINELFFSSKDLNIENIIKLSDSKTYEISGLKNKNETFPTLIKSKDITFDNCLVNIILIIDMTDIKDKENLLIQQSKMASMGEMIGNIAHQWRQPLSFISTAASGMRVQKQYNQLEDTVLIETLDEINTTTKFLSQTIEDFQNYLKDDKIKKEFDINKSIDTILNITKGSFVNNFINVKLDLGEDLLIKGFENELNQALLNILNNSKDALKETRKENRYVFIKSYKIDESVTIEIIDNAGGIPESILNKVFEPYFTTKHKSQGTGLGLYMTHMIITDSLKGQIKIENVQKQIEDNNLYKCTKVIITLPIS